MDPRFYRTYGDEKDVAFRVGVATTDLYIRADSDLSALAFKSATLHREEVQKHIECKSEFLCALAPLPCPEGDIPKVVKDMYSASAIAGVGPMAAVAGAIAEAVGVDLRPHTSRVIVENGGDIYIDTDRPITVGIFAGLSIFSGKIGIKLVPDGLPISICTSSATVGPSLSFGNADAATVISRSAALADAVASGLGNRLQTSADIESALNWAVSVPGVMGALAIIDDKMGALGQVLLERI